ncbi:MAG: hypothetical protein ABL977_11420 [Candidatus Eisenbacteria bacterium]
MKSTHISLTLRAAVVLAMAVTLGACSRSQSVSEAVSGPVRVGAGENVVLGCPTLIANTPAAPSVFTAVSASLPQLRSNRLRLEAVGDVADLPSLESMGDCMSSATPSIFVVSGHANVFLSGTTTSISGPMTFGALPSGGLTGEPGVVVGQDAIGNVLEIIWPALAGTGVGQPIVRIQLARWNTSLINPATRLDIVWDMQIQQDANIRFVTGRTDAIPTDGTSVVPGGGAVVPCPATLGAGGAVVNQAAGVVQWTRRALRSEIIGDDALGTINAVGACAASAAPSIVFTGGTGSVRLAGTTTAVSQPANMTFGPLLFPGLLAEPGVVVAQDANRNVLEIIWPALAGGAPGAPILRLQLGRWTNAAVAGRRVDVAMRFNALGPDGRAASFTANAAGLVLPAQR